MQRSNILGAALTAALLISAPLFAAAPRPYHLVLQASPAAPFPFLSRFGNVDLHVFPGGVRAETIWLNGFSRNGAAHITVENPFGRMYTEVPVKNVGAIVSKLGGSAMAKKLDTSVIPPLLPPVNGTVHGIRAQRYRIQFGPAAWIDFWTTRDLGDAPQMHAIVQQIVSAISPNTARTAERIPGVPLYVELNFSHFHKLPILKVKELTFSGDGESDALSTGRLYIHAPLLDSLWK